MKAMHSTSKYIFKHPNEGMHPYHLRGMAHIPGLCSPIFYCSQLPFFLHQLFIKDRAVGMSVHRYCLKLHMHGDDKKKSDCFNQLLLVSLILYKTHRSS